VRYLAAIVVPEATDLKSVTSPPHNSGRKTSSIENIQPFERVTFSK
jgi:hypothetical protein